MRRIKNNEPMPKVQRRSKESSSDRLLSLLMLFSEQSHPRSIEDLARETGLPHSTIYRYIKTLSDVGLIVAVSAGCYVLGPSIILLDRQMRLSDPLLNSAEQVKARLAAELPSPGMVLVCRLFRNSVMCVDSAGSGRLGFIVSYSRGRALPLHRGAASKVILAHLPLRNVKALFEADAAPFASAGLGEDWRTVRTSLRKIRQQGFSISHGELDQGALGFGSPVLAPDGQILGSLAYVTQEDATDERAAEQIRTAIQAGAKEIEANLATFLHVEGDVSEEHGRG